jgi:Mg-chelatase subunit ChlD
MTVNRIILGLIGLALIISSVAAYNLDGSQIKTSQEWLVANNGLDKSTITVTVIDADTNIPIPDADVVFSLDDASSSLGTISPVKPTVVRSDAAGKAIAVFTTSTKSGTAIILATISYPADGVTIPVAKSVSQKIDHDTPAFATFDNIPNEVLVGTEDTAILRVTDRWNNPVDNKNIAESVHITMTGKAGAAINDAGTYVPDKTYLTDAEGKVSIAFRASTIKGDSNKLWMDPIDSMPVGQTKTITGITDGIPVYLLQTAARNSDWELSPFTANGLEENNAVITYTLTDKYGNTIPGVSMLFRSDPDEITGTLTTNDDGYIVFTFNARDYAATYTLTASTPISDQVKCKDAMTGLETGEVGSCTQSIAYVSDEPVDLILTGNPQHLVSSDVIGTTNNIATLNARVIDAKGNPVVGQEVFFEMGDYVPDVSADPLLPPTLDVLPTQAVLVAAPEGYATAHFTSGGFIVNGDDYNPTATGTLKVKATWTPTGKDPITKDITLTWKNYPYISTSATMDCTNAHVGDLLNITVQLSGDGAALRPDPIDVVLLLDRSGSMMYDDTDTEDRMVEVMTASKVFVEQLGAQDQIALIAFGSQGNLVKAATYPPISGKYYLGPGKDSDISDDTTYVSAQYKGSGLYNWNEVQIVQVLTTDSAAIDTGIDSLVPAGGTPMKAGLIKAIAELQSTRARSNAVKAIVLLSDGEATDGSNAELIALGTTAKNAGIKVFTIGFGEGSTADPVVLQGIATNSEGQYYPATSANIEDVYKDIAGKLKDVAGAETVVNLNFGDITIADGLGGEIKDYMEYQYVSSGPEDELSTVINNSILVENELTGVKDYTRIFFGTHNDGPEWESGAPIVYNVNEIKLDQTWSATLRLKMIDSGSFSIFGPDSSSFVSFKDLKDPDADPVSSFIPAIECKVNEVGQNTEITQVSLALHDLIVEKVDPSKWKLAWFTDYTGNSLVTETVQYSREGTNAWQNLPGVDTMVLSSPATDLKTIRYLPLADATIWAPGTCWDFRIVTTSPEAGAVPPLTTAATCIEGTSDVIYIKLE